MSKAFLGAVSVALTFGSFVPYIASILHGRTRPHVFSWIIWTITTLIVFAAQLADGGGAGAWPTGVSGVITLAVAGLAWRRDGERSITRSDRLFFALALASLPLWALTSDPLASVAILTAVDVLGFAPTFRKIYHAPYDEQMTFYALMVVRTVLSIFALENFSWTTVLFPAAISAASAAFIAMVLWRRRFFNPPPTRL